MKNKFIKLAGSLSFFILLGCQDILECVVNSHPELPNKIFARGRIDHFYSDSFRSDIKNNVHDDGFFYNYSISGNLPEGLDYYVEHRTFIIEGTPRERGRFRFSVYLYAEKDYNYFYDCENEFNNCDGLCEDSTSKDYIIEIY